MTTIRTVLGDIPATELGVCYAHEHIVIDRSFVTQQTPDFLLDDVTTIAGELRSFYAAGGRAMVDSMPCGGGRNVTKLAAVSAQTGVHILCPTGAHLAKYYPHGHWTERATVDQIARIFIDEINLGIDSNDTNGPVLDRTAHKAGLIKVASGLNAIDTREQKIFEAAAIAHCATGAPVLTHTEEGTAGLEQVELLSRLGVAPRHVVISHLDRRPDAIYHREVLSTGVSLEYDSAFRWKSDQNPTLDLLLDRIADGYVHQLMLGMDAARNRYWAAFGGSPGLNFLLTTFARQLLDQGLTDEHLAAIFTDNPSRAYALSRDQI
jgi:phosphotriesterase-related protein